MTDTRPAKRRWTQVFLAIAAIGLCFGAGWTIFGKCAESIAATPDGAEITGSTGRVLGASTGLPLPRFVSLKSAKTNVRGGPSSDHQVVWVFQRKGLPVEVVAESDNWRRIRDSDGEEGWILQNMLAGKRTGVVMPWQRQAVAGLYGAPQLKGGIVARLEAGVVGEIESCAKGWCEFSAGGQQGYIEQAKLWGVYPDETVDN